MKKWILAAVAAASIIVLSGCAGGMKRIEIKVKEMAFGNTEIHLKTGQPVELVLVNNDTVIHDLSVDTIAITAGTEPVEEDAHEHGTKRPDLHVSAKPGEKGTFVFTPIQEGTYTFYCTVDGHMAHGMKGTLVVSADGR